MMKYIQCLFYLCSLGVQYTHSQYVSFQRRPEKTNLCDNTSNNSLVENFFNFIFAEFHNNPPVCVCVQMCYDQPTYCYPNGCLKRQENKKKPEEVPPQVSKVQSDKLNSMTFLVNDHSNFMADYLGKKSAIDGKVPAMPIQPITGEFAPDVFKDRYKTLFKYKKMPKVHLRYNLREQVKNKMDSIRVEKIDVSKTRWPVNKNMHLNDNNKRFIIEKKFFDKVDGTHLQFSPSLSAEEERSQFQFQFKRDLTNKSNFTDKVDLLDEPEDSTENPSFSLDHLIENLIKTSFGPFYNGTELDLNINLDYSTNNKTTPEPTTTPSKRSIFDSNTTIIINETTVMSINLTNENSNHNKYEDDSTGEESYKNAFKEMIESMSRSIDQQNNSSIEIMEQYIGKRLNVSYVSAENASSYNSINTNATRNDIATATESSQTETERYYEGTTKMKSRQRVKRKQNRKIN